MKSSEISIKINKIKEYFTEIRDLKGLYKFYDMHVHPFEIFFPKCNYNIHNEDKGLYSIGTSEYCPPHLSDISIDDGDYGLTSLNIYQRPAVFRLKYSILYAHTGPKVFGAHMRISLIDRILFLPVAPLEGCIDQQMDEMKRMYYEDKRFYFGWSISNTLKNEDIYESARNAIEKFNITAIKLHLCQTEINLNCPSGKERMENILEVSDKLNLSLIIHTGKGYLTKNPESADYGKIEYLKNINWGLSSHPVVFAHACSYGYKTKEIKNNILPQLKHLVAKNDNLLIDISGINMAGLRILLDSLPKDMILFGSDALYESQWQSVVKLYSILKESTTGFESDFLKIMSINTEKYICKNFDHPKHH